MKSSDPYDDLIEHWTCSCGTSDVNCLETMASVSHKDNQRLILISCQQSKNHIKREHTNWRRSFSEKWVCIQYVYKEATLHKE